MTALTYPKQPLRGRFNAWFFDTFDGLIDHYLSERKRDLYSGLNGTILEIGPGIGANFRYYPAGATVIAVEPNPEMHGRLRHNAESHGIDLQLLESKAEQIALADESVDVVVSSLVLCTVESPRRALREVKRVLKPGGRFLFLEHVDAKRGWLKGLQRLVSRPWRYVFEGCDLQRDLESVVGDAGFGTLNVNPYRLRSIFVPVNAQIEGVAIK